MRPIFFSCLLYFSFSTLPAIAQNEANIWYFGDKAGVSFKQQNPVSLSDGVLSTEEGVATICDKAGNLLFYTDGVKVYNAKHAIMPDGQDLKGHPSSTQSGVVIPVIGISNQYYLFTVAAAGGVEGLCYSIIDMAEGLGNVQIATKNKKLHTPITEKLTAVKHRNGKDIWIIAHEWLSDKFLAYLITEKGVQETPILSLVGSPHKGNDLNTQGYMKANADGTNIALALEADQAVELFDFDNATGKLSQPIRINFVANSYPYGIEFSPNGSLLYVSAAGTGKIYQYNLQTLPADSISTTQVEVGKSPNAVWVGALQLAPDGKIYFPIYNTNFLGVINMPNTQGVDCKYQNNAVSLGTGIAKLGLPTFNQSFFQEKISTDTRYFDDKTVKIGDKLILKNVHFDYAQYSLQPISFAELDKLAGYLQRNPTVQINLLGHTDNIGNKPANITLSLNRAKAVKEYLIKKQIKESRISYEGFGSGTPITTNDTDEGRAKNRRVEVQILE